MVDGHNHTLLPESVQYAVLQIAEKGHEAIVKIEAGRLVVLECQRRVRHKENKTT